MEDSSSNLRVSYGSDHILSGHAEDRISTTINHEAEGFPHISSFGVFDGHNGYMAAAICSQFFIKSILLRYKSLLEAIDIIEELGDEYDDLSDQEQKDALLCECVRITSIEMDKHIQQYDVSGCTVNCILLDQQTDKELTRIYCINIGDSRTVMFTPDIPSKDPHPVRLKEFALPSPESTEYLSQYHRSFSASDKRHIQLSEDHKLSLDRERYRIMDRSTADYLPLPSDINLCEMIAFAEVYDVDPNLDEAISPGYLDWGYPPPETLKLATEFVNAATAIIDVSKQMLSYTVDYDADSAWPLDPYVHPQASHHDDSLAPLILHQESYIATRETSHGAKGPEAVFGRYGLSINMTRSMGDRYGPRIVQAVPEVSVISVPHDRFARLAACSDGVWEVLGNAVVKELLFRHRSPQRAAEEVAVAAGAARAARQLRDDDVSVIVADVNNHLFPSAWEELAGRVKQSCLVT